MTVEYLETGADEQSGIIMKNTKGEMVVMCLTLVQNSQNEEL